MPVGLHPSSKITITVNDLMCTGINVVLDALLYAPCPIDALLKNCSKILGNSEIEQNHSIYSVCILFNAKDPGIEVGV